MPGIKWWTEERVEFLRLCAARGIPARRTARLLSARFRREVTEQAVRNIALDRGIRFYGRRGRRPKGTKGGAA